tara:strand:+ start:133 stop:471 length:339 start_codon:yes stop_codon:yes gene_type:complete
MRKFEFKPWGWYLTLEEKSDFKVKTIHVSPGHQFSLQYHEHREEHWTIVEGIGTITQGDIESIIRPGEYAYIPVRQVHRLHGGDSGVTFIEVQRGVCKEDDIIRLKDDYGRG